MNKYMQADGICEFASKPSAEHNDQLSHLNTGKQKTGLKQTLQTDTLQITKG